MLALCVINRPKLQSHSCCTPSPEQSLNNLGVKELPELESFGRKCEVRLPSICIHKTQLLTLEGLTEDLVMVQSEAPEGPELAELLRGRACVRSDTNEQ